MGGTTSSADLQARQWRARAALPVLVAVSGLVAVVTSLGAPLIPSIAHSDGVSPCWWWDAGSRGLAWACCR
jgi:hypothetical protein